MNIQKNIFVASRFVMGFIFMWAFIDKTFGLGFATTKANAWINGGSPTSGFLEHAVSGPFVDFFHSLAGMAVVDWLFMIGLFVVGMTLIFNRYVKLGAYTGCAMLALMYLSLLFPGNNPLIDEHIVYILMLLLIAHRSDY